MAVHGSIFNPSLEVDQDLGLADVDSEVGEPDSQQNMVLEMVDARAQLDMLIETKGYSMATGSSASRAAGFEGSVGASTVNPDCSVRKREVNMQKAIKHATLKGHLVDSVTEIQVSRRTYRASGR